MKNKLAYAMLAAVTLLDSILLTITVIAQTTAVEYIAFSSNRNGNYDLYIIDRHGENLQRFTDQPTDEMHGRWSPNGRYLAYASNENAIYFDIYVMDMRTKHRWRLTDHPENDTCPAWSPDGTRIAFCSNRSGKYRIYTMDINGGNLRQLTKGGSDWGPSWSPDGKWIAYNSLQPDNFVYLYIVSTDNKKPKQLARAAEKGPHQTWSPDSKRIAFSTWEVGIGPNIATIDEDGRNLRGVTLGGRVPQGRVFMKYSPAWSPDGKYIVYVSDNVAFQHRSFIYVVDAAGEEHAESIRLTTGLSANISPTWVPASFFAVSPSAEKITTLWGQLKQHESTVF